MMLHEFYVCNEDFRELSREELGQINGFTSFRKASAAARKHSMTHAGRFSVGVCVPGTMYENGRAKKGV
jgi:hypothetical protein